MTYRVFGLNYNTAPVAVRENFEQDTASLERLYRTVERRGDTEWLVLSTCNRVEVYLHGPDEAADPIRQAMAHGYGEWPEEHAFDLRDVDAVRHVIEVVAGLRSQVLGDGQILAQTKTAYRAAAVAGTLGPWMHRLMHTAFAAAKRIITETGIGSSGASVARSAVQHVLQNGARSVAVLGGGQMAELVLEELAGFPDIEAVVLNRTAEKAQSLADRFGAASAPWTDRYAAIARTDATIGATAAPSTVVTASEILPPEAGRHPLLIDIAVPRDFDEAIPSTYRLINIDELLGHTEDADPDTLRRVAGASVICEEAAVGVIAWEHEHQALQPAIHTLQATFESVRQREVERNLHRFHPSDHEQVDRLTRSIMQKLLAIPVVRLKSMAESEQGLARRIEILNALFQRVKCEEYETARDDAPGHDGFAAAVGGDGESRPVALDVGEAAGCPHAAAARAAAAKNGDRP